jgi:4'-phosphopantetheinyl transferase
LIRAVPPSPRPRPAAPHPARACDHVGVPVDESCRVWWAAPVDPASAPGLLALLDVHERARLDRFRRAPDRARYLAAHALARLVLASLVGERPEALTFDRTCRCGAPHGKPTRAGGPEFSLTHGGDLVGVAVRLGGGPVGLDVEPVRPLSDLDGMARHVSSPAELARQPAADPDAFLAAWTRKEALLKATGDGISSPMAAITLGPDGVLEWTGNDAPARPVWLRDLHPAPGYRAAVAGLGGAPASVVEHDARPIIAAGAR